MYHVFISGVCVFNHYDCGYFRPPRAKSLDQGSAREMAVTVDNVTVIITDYAVKKRKISAEATKNNVPSDMSDTSSNASNDILEERTVNNNSS